MANAPILRTDDREKSNADVRVGDRGMVYDGAGVLPPGWASPPFKFGGWLA